MAEGILDVESAVQAPKACATEEEEDRQGQETDDDIEDQDFVPSEVSSSSSDDPDEIEVKTSTKPGRFSQKVVMDADGSDSDVVILALPEPKVAKRKKPTGLSKYNDPQWIDIFKQFPDQFVDHVFKNKLGKSN